MRMANRRHGRRIAAAALIALASPTVAQELGPGADRPASEAERQYSGCLALARKSPAQAYSAALAWRDQGGGDPAQHCAAAALLGMGHHDRAAREMEALAASMKERGAREALRAELLGQAANAWILAGRPRDAEAALDRALTLAPDNAALLVDRGIARASQDRNWEALDDFNRALEIDPDRVDALVFRAAAWRRAGSLDLAAEDAAHALALDHDNLDALLERGLIRKQMGDPAAARADWLRVVELAADGPIREAARRNLEAMDVRTN